MTGQRAQAHLAPQPRESTEPVTRPAPKPLSDEDEKDRQARSMELYGSPGGCDADGTCHDPTLGTPDIQPFEARKTSIFMLGDSVASGEGTDDYEAVRQACHRGTKSAIQVTRITVDVRFNLACSGATSENIKIGGKETHWAPIQTRELAIDARNTRALMIAIFAGANDDIQFSNVVTDCVKRWVGGGLYRDYCYQGWDPGWQDRVAKAAAKVKQDLLDIQTTMADAGYLRSDYQLVLMSYPSFFSHDSQDNGADFPGYSSGGCTLYTQDQMWARNRAVAVIEDNWRRAAAETGVTFVNNSHLFNGHEICSRVPWNNGLRIKSWVPFEAYPESFHPDVAGHAAFGECLAQAYGRTESELYCVDAKGTDGVELIPADHNVSPYQQVRSELTGLCVTTKGHSSRKTTYNTLRAAVCAAGQDQQFYWDGKRGGLHLMLSHDRCVAAWKAVAGEPIRLDECVNKDVAGTTWSYADKRFTLAGTNLCLATGPKPAKDALGEPIPDTTLPVGRELQLQTCEDIPQQRFELVAPVGESFQQVSNADGKCLGTDGGSAYDGQAVKAVDCDDSKTDQFWWFNPRTRQMHNLANVSFCLDRQGASDPGKTYWRAYLSSCATPYGQLPTDKQWEVSGSSIRLPATPNWQPEPGGPEQEPREALTTLPDGLAVVDSDQPSQTRQQWTFGDTKTWLDTSWWDSDPGPSPWNKP